MMKQILETVIRLNFIFSIIFSLIYLPSTIAHRNCFQLHKNFRLKCATPIAKRPQLSLAECQQYCLSQPADCLSAQYDYYRKNCELFNIASPFEQYEINNIGKYKKRSIPINQQEIDCYPTIQRSIGSVHLIPNITCLVPMDSTDVRHHKPIPQLLIQQIKKQMMTEEPEAPPKNPFQGVEVLPIVPDCPIGERARVQIIDGVDVATPASVVITTTSPEKCIETCRASTYPDGRRLPLLCRSSAFNRVTSTCSLFHDSLNPNGYLEYRPDYNVLYMEKICVAEKILPLSCDDVFRRVPQHILLGHAAEIVTSASQLECIRECIEAKNRQLDCRSILHYIDVPTSNCILNIHTRNSRPEYFVPELKYKVDYIELSPCATLPLPSLKMNPATQSITSIVDGSAILLQNPNKNQAITIVKPKLLNVGHASVESEWSEWTTCDPSSGIRERDRVCTDCDDDRIQTEPCVPNNNNEFNTALEKFVKDQEVADNAEGAGFPVITKTPSGVIPFPILSSQSRDGPIVTVRSPNSDVQFFGPPMTSAKKTLEENEVNNDFDLKNGNINNKNRESFSDLSESRSFLMNLETTI